MKQVKQIIEFILVLASCFFRFKKQQTEYDPIPSVPDPPNSDDERERDCYSRPGHSVDPEPAQSPESLGSSASGATAFIPGNSSAPIPGNSTTPISTTPIPGNSEATSAANLLGWCLIVVAGTSYLYKLLA